MSHHHHRPDTDSSPTNLTPFKGAKGATVPSPPNLEPRSTPNLHHHHVPRHHHHHHHVNAKASAPVNIIVPLVKRVVRNQAVLDQVKDLPRFNLGSAYYQSDLRPGGPNITSKLTNKRMTKHVGGFKSTPNPLPPFKGKDNSVFTVKIPPVYLDEISRREITKRSAVWGTDIYTDDSDVIAACIHQGWFRGAWNEDVAVELLDLEIEVDEPQEPFSVDNIMTCPPPTGPIVVPEGYECHVTLVILPQLQKYGSMTRFGLRSKEWGYTREGYTSAHDGVSFMIHSIEWVRGVDQQEGRNRASRRKIFAKQLNNRELEQESEWDDLLQRREQRMEIGESFERGPRPGDIQDTKPWLTGINRPSPKGKEKEATRSPTPIRSPTPVLPRILGPLPPPIPSPLSSPIMAPEPLEEEEVTPNMAALLASSLEADRAFVGSVARPLSSHRMTSSQEIRIERVTERMVENANLMEPVRAEVIDGPEIDSPIEEDGPSIEDAMDAHDKLLRGVRQAVDNRGAVVFDPIAALADIAVANEEADAAAQAAANALVGRVVEEQSEPERIKEEPVERSVQEIMGTPSIFG